MSPVKSETHSQFGLAAAEAKPDTVEPPLLARVPLPSRALAAVAAQLKQYITAKEQRLLAVADKAATAAPAADTDDKLAQQWQVTVCVFVCVHVCVCVCVCVCVHARIVRCCSQLYRLHCSHASRLL